MKSAKYNHLREQLDKSNYVNSFDLNSISLVETLFKDINKIKNDSLENEHLLKIEKDKNEKQSLTLKAMQYKLNILVKENQEWHLEVLRLMNTVKQGDKKEIELKNWQNDKQSMMYLITEWKGKLKNQIKDNFFIKEKYLGLITGWFNKTLNLEKWYLEQKESEDQDKSNPHAKPITLNEMENNFKLVVGKPDMVLSSNIYSNGQNNVGKNDEEWQKMLMLWKNKRTYNPCKQDQSDKDQEILLLKDEWNKKNNAILVLENKNKNYFNYNYMLDSNANTNNDASLVDLTISNLSNHHRQDHGSSSSNHSNSNIFIEYLTNELKVTKEKYDNYIKFLLSQVNTLNSTVKENNMKNKDDCGNNNDKVLRRLKEENKNYSIKVSSQEHALITLKQELQSALSELQHFKAYFNKMNSNFNIKLSACSEHTIQIVPSLRVDPQKEWMKITNENLILNTEIKAIKEENENMQYELKEKEQALVWWNTDYNHWQDQFNFLNKRQYKDWKHEEDKENEINELIVEKRWKEDKFTKITNENIKLLSENRLLIKEVNIKNNEIQRWNEWNNLYESQIKFMNDK